jgi:hypothetical protein
MIRTGVLVVLVACAASRPPRDVPFVPPATCSVAGHWRGEGYDARGDHWMVQLDAAQLGTYVTAHFQWQFDGSDLIADQHTVGSVDCSGHALALLGAISNHNIVDMSFTLALDVDDTVLVGTWVCPDAGCVDGTLRAVME